MTRGSTIVVEAWKSFWFREVPGNVYALIRIALGAVGLAALIGLSNLDLYWIPGGLESTEPSELKSYFVDLGLGREAALAIFGISLGSTLAMTVGLYTGLTVPLTFLLVIAHTQWNPLPMSSAFSVYRCLLFCLIWAHAGSQWSLDRWLLANRQRTEAPCSPQDQPVWPLRLMRFQMGLVYLSAGLWKVAYPEWHSGSALHYVLAGAGFNRFPPPPPVLDPVVVAWSYIILAWELLFVVLVVLKPTRRLVLWFGILAHIGMGIVMELGVFSAVMLVGYLAFLDPDSVGDWKRSIRFGSGRGGLLSVRA